LRQTGLRVSSRALGEEFSARPRVATATEAGDPLDVLFIATKAIGLPAALDRVRATPGLVVPLLNGLEHLELLRGRFGAERVAAAVIRIESDRPSPGVIVQTSPGVRVDMASATPSLGPALDETAELLRGAGLQARVGDSEAQVMWSKLARLCALALTTSASDRPIGDVRSDPRWRSALEGAVSETVAVANADGAVLQASDTLAELDSAHAELGSSMQRDLAAGRPTELDAIAGAVVRAGQRHGLRCPTVQWLAERVAVREARAVA
ncbi:MAG: 2-dehydropantoate 2-reductase, partial [Solirubrobacteraceae bacterium]